MSDPPVVVFLILVTCAVSLWAFQRPEVEARYIFRPEGVLADKEYYRLVTSAFLHAGWGHLLLNMYTLYSFGGTICWIFGQWQFLFIYFGSILGGSLLSLYLHRHHDYAAYGASGGVCGLIFAYVLRFPHSHLTLFPLPYAVPAWLYAVAFIIASFYALKSGHDHIGHDAHLGGAMVGLLIAAYLRPALVQQHWIAFLAMLVAAGLILAYLLGNPMFLPISAVVRWPRWPTARTPKPKTAARKSSTLRRTPGQPIASQWPGPVPVDWLIQEIEVQVGKLEKDASGTHHWVDRFGRTYDVIRGQPQAFDPSSFQQEILTRLNRPNVKFVIVDTRDLLESQVNSVRAFLADLPDDQFNRVIRSFAFKQKE